MPSTATSRLPAFEKDAEHWNVVIETPKGSCNKYKYDEDLGVFRLNGVLPEGMAFPYDFGYLPSTVGDDGDPLDVLLMMDHPAFCGCLVPARLIGVIEAEQTESDGTTERNDRLVAVSTDCRIYAEIKTVKDMEKARIDEIEQFFVSYNRVRGKKFKVLGLHGPRKAEELAEEGIKQFAKKGHARAASANSKNGKSKVNGRAGSK